MENVYEAGETTKLSRPSLIVAAAEGYKTAMVVDLVSTILKIVRLITDIKAL